MPFDLDRFEKARPVLFYLTSHKNLDRIRAQRKLFSASHLLRKSGETDWITKKRKGHLTVKIGEQSVVIRDQDPLHEGNTRLDVGWNFSQLLELLNNQVFFWPGTDEGPISYGVRHLERYRSENPVILRVPFSDITRSNQGQAPFFCRYNSGAPRCSGGKGSPRGPNTFVQASNAAFTPSKVVEVVFREQITLPDTTEYSSDLSATWRSLASG